MEYSRQEELANAVSHGIGTALSAAALVVLVIYAATYGDVWHIVSFAIFGAALVLLYLFSTLLHSVRRPGLKAIFAIMDHSAIYVLIAGTYTPFLLVPLRGPLGWTLFGIVWGLAFCGIVFKMFFVERFMILSTLMYIAMGWMIVIAIKPLYDSLPLNGLIWLVAGGLLYTFGTIFYVWRKIPYHHTIWHVFVLGGSVSHFIAVFYLLLQHRANVRVWHRCCGLFPIWPSGLGLFLKRLNAADCHHREGFHAVVFHLSPKRSSAFDRCVN
jgi:hemolysin III